MIKQKNISIIANRSNKNGGKMIPEAVIERDYCLAWFLFGLAQSSIKNVLIFKGGTALRRCYFNDYRFSEDLDFTLLEKVSLNDVLAEFDSIYSWVKEESGIVFANEPQASSSLNTHTFHVAYDGPLPGKAKKVKVDVTFIETILTPVEERKIIRSYDEYEDFLDEPKIKVYSLSEVVIEKTCALFSPGRNEPRDLFDIYCLLEKAGIEVDFLAENVAKKMKFKGKIFDQMNQEFLKKERTLEKLWEKRLTRQMNVLPEYGKVFRCVKRAFRQAGLILHK